MRHIPVLKDEVIDLLAPKPGGTAIDCTLGDGGHSELLLEKLGPQGKLLGIDADPESLSRAKENLSRFGKAVTLVCGNFSKVSTIAEEAGFSGADIILADLGWSTPQFKERGRGFSFEKNEPLDMRYHPPGEEDEEKPESAADLLHNQSEFELAALFRQLGEEKFALPIAARIAEVRKAKPLTTTGELVEIILSVYREKLGSTKEVPWIGGIHPATKIFQALRIAVNNELGVLKAFLPQALSVLKPGGRLGIITFHSLEDRIVKHYFVRYGGKQFRIITKKPITATSEELVVNPASRSAKLRVVEKL